MFGNKSKSAEKKTDFMIKNKLIKLKLNEKKIGNSDEDLDIDIDQPLFARPKHDGLDALCQMTHYDKKGI